MQQQSPFLGELGHEKGRFGIPAIIVLVVKEIPTVKFVLCEAGNQTDEAFSKEKGIGGNVEFLGRVSDGEFRHC